MARPFILPAVAAVSFLAGMLTSAAGSQASGPSQPQSSPVVVRVDYMKAEPGRASDYVRMERETWMPIHRERIRRGVLRSWDLYQVQFPYGTETPYDYVTVNVLDSLTHLDRSPVDIITKLYPNIPLDTIARRASGARKLVRGEVWRRIEHLQ